jgi:putative spermidine/putrescine transport system ATP-binding protein
VPGAEIRRRVAEALEMVHLPDFAARYPEQMSGGQRQRVALARAIVVRPDILLLDEPLGALDRRLRDAMQVELKQLQRSVGITTIIVTHDQEEALSLSHRVAVMFDGRLAAVGSPAALYADPGSAQVMDFLGAVNLVEGVVAGGRLSGIPVPGPDGPARFGIRPEHVEIAPEGAIPCTVEEVVFKGPGVSVLAEGPGGLRIHASVPATTVADLGLARGGAVRLNFPVRHLVRLDG